MTIKPVIILGAGGHAKVVAEALRLSGREILGYVTHDLPTDTVFFGSVVLGDDSIVFDYSNDEIELVNGLGVLPGQHRRSELASIMRAKGYHFATVIHPSAILASDVVLGEGAQVMAAVVVQPGTTIGSDAIINTGAIIDHDCVIGENCHIAPGVACSGNVLIGENAHIGTGAKVIQGIGIGKGSVIAAGSTIYKDVLPDNLVKQRIATVIEKIRT